MTTAPLTATLPDQASVARHNRTLVIDALRRSGPTSRTGLVSSTRLTKATISVIVDGLLAGGLVREIGPAVRPGPGRPALLLEYVASAHLVAGVHLGIRSTHVVLADGNGTTVADRRVPTRRAPARALAEVADTIRALAAEGVGPAGPIAHVALCLPGWVDGDSGLCHRAPNLGWTDVPVGDLLSRDLGLPVSVLNDAQAALVAEHESGAARGVDDVLVLYAGDGVSAAVLHQGALFRGAHGATGEIGHCPVPGGTRPCGCGRTGCLETEANTAAVLTAVRDALAAAGEAPPSAGRLTADAVLDAARSGDPSALAAVRAAGDRLGQAAGVLVNLFDPQVIILAGQLARAGAPYAEAVSRAAERVALPASWRLTEVRLARYADDAEVIGAVAEARRRLDPLRREQAVATP